MTENQILQKKGKFNFVYLIILIGTISFNSACSQSENAAKNNSTTIESADKLIDERDQKEYKIRTIGNQTWLASDLKYKTPNSICYNNDPKNCENFGALYHFNEAKIACPKGWKLPTDKDWKILEMELGMEKTQADSIRIWRGKTEGDLLKKELRINYSGMVDPSGKEFQAKSVLVKYWADTAGPTGEQFSIYRMFMKNESRIYSDQAAKMNLFCVRCVKE